ncbi:MAG: hypothetical protein J6A19_04940 [Oscillospiraceae bacterium]|nr:hypothetical protein [Oscillospiraceae bacterium]
MINTNWLEKTKESYNDYYKTYRADWCRKTGLPMYNSDCFDKVKDAGLYSLAERKRSTSALTRRMYAGGITFGMDMFQCSSQ